MSKLNRVILIVFLFSVIFSCFMVCNSFASNINMNLAQEENVTDNGNPGNNIRNQTENTNTSVNNNQTGTLNTNTQATVQSVEEFQDNTGSFDFSGILNILLLAVGLVIILLGIAILIRLNK